MVVWLGLFVFFIIFVVVYLFVLSHGFNVLPRLASNLRLLHLCPSPRAGTMDVHHQGPLWDWKIKFRDKQELSHPLIQ